MFLNICIPKNYELCLIIVSFQPTPTSLEKNRFSAGVGSNKSLYAIRESNGEILTEHPVAELVVSLSSVIEARIEEDLRCKVTVKLEGERVFPLRFRAFIGGVAVQTRSPGDVVGELPSEVDRCLRTEIAQRMVSRIDTVVGSKGQSAYILKVVSERC